VRHPYLSIVKYHKIKGGGKKKVSKRKLLAPMGLLFMEDKFHLIIETSVNPFTNHGNSTCEHCFAMYVLIF
jgi:hypothetical protein